MEEIFDSVSIYKDDEGNGIEKLSKCKNRQLLTPQGKQNFLKESKYVYSILVGLMWITET